MGLFNLSHENASIDHFIYKEFANYANSNSCFHFVDVNKMVRIHIIIRTRNAFLCS